MGFGWWSYSSVAIYARASLAAVTRITFRYGALNSMKVITNHPKDSKFDAASAYRVYSQAGWELLSDKAEPVSVHSFFDAAMDAAARDEVHGQPTSGGLLQAFIHDPVVDLRSSRTSSGDC